MERSFVILKYYNKVPAMAGCARCQHKFFTPNIYYNDHVGAEEYLHGKFDLHTCEDAGPPRRVGTSVYHPSGFGDRGRW